MSLKNAFWLAALLALGGAQAAAGQAEIVRARLVEAGLESAFDAASATALVNEARAAFSRFSQDLAAVAPNEAARAETALAEAASAAAMGDGEALSKAQGEVWTAILQGAWTGTLEATDRNDVGAAERWFALREFRTARTLTRLGAEGTLALENWKNGTLSASEARAIMENDVLDAYGARLNESLEAASKAASSNYRTMAAEQSALARGYFSILADKYAVQHGPEALSAINARFAALPTGAAELQRELQGFRAAPLSDGERRMRTSQALRFLSLVPVEYARGVKMEGQTAVLTQEVEVAEARVFLDGARSALLDLMSAVPAETRPQAQGWLNDMNALQTALEPAALSKAPLVPSEVKSRSEALTTAMKAALPEDWQRQEAGAELDVIRTQIAAVSTAAAAGDWAAAETARLDAYSLLEMGTEARIAVFNPDLKLRLEELLWNGQQPSGLARLIEKRASTEDFSATTAALEAALAETAEILGQEVAPAAVATNAGIIVFREGLEAVLILAALMGGMRKGPMLKLRRPMWIGAAGAFVATAATWWVMAQTIGLLGQYGEKLEAVVSLIAIAVLLLIMNWFFHQVYWNDHIHSFQKTKYQLTHASKQEQRKAHLLQWWGLMVLGFTAIYREGFETVLFLQSLVLQGGTGAVLSGTFAGLALVLGVGALVFYWQAKLPMKDLLIFTGMLICAVLGVMVGNTVHTMQLVGWFPVSPLPLRPPAWAGLWFGVHGTWQGILLQIASMAAVVGSFFWAEDIRKKAKAEKDAARSKKPIQKGEMA